MSSYVYDPARSYLDHLRSAAEAPASELPARAALLLGAPTGEPAGAGLFTWDRPESLMAAGGYATPLTELKHRARNNAEMWAGEQFDIARDAFRRRLWPEALAHVGLALRGDERHDGYALDYRFHFLLGLIHLGAADHHDPAFVAPSLAADDFLQAARYAKTDQPREAALAFFAAGWAAYVQGDAETALTYTEQAILLDPGHPAFHFQAAKLLARTARFAEFSGHITRAVAHDPAYAALAVTDADFAAAEDLVYDVLVAERENAGRAAMTALQAATLRIEELGLAAAPAEADSAAEGAPETETGATLALLELARTAFAESTIHGYRRAAILANRAKDTLDACLARGAKARSLAEDALRSAEEEARELSAIQIGGYRLGLVAIHELNRATNLVGQARAATAAGTLPGYLEAERLAGRALILLDQTVDHFKASALQMALAESAELDRQIAAQRTPPGAGDRTAVKACAAIGALVALFPGGFLGIFSLGSSAETRWPELILRGGLSVAVFAAVGGLLGALFAPVISGDARAERALAERKAVLKATISALRDFSLRKIRPASGV